VNVQEAEATSRLPHRVEIIVSDVLRWGVAGSLVLLVIGTLLCFLGSADYGSGGGSAADLQRLIRPDANLAFSFGWFFHGLAHLQGPAIVVAGLLMLIATPVARVLISIFAFVIDRDWPFVSITTVVFVLLILSVVIGRAR
jgi:uncharacterized membrane protein